MEPTRAQASRQNRIAAISKEFRSLNALALALRNRTLRYFKTLNRTERSEVLRRFLNKRRKVAHILIARRALRLVPPVESAPSRPEFQQTTGSDGLRSRWA